MLATLLNWCTESLDSDTNRSTGPQGRGRSEVQHAIEEKDLEKST